MADKQISPPPNAEAETTSEPRGFGPHSRGLAGEYAHEQGWGLNEEERKAIPTERQPEDGGLDYDYGARDFGDSPTDTSAAGTGDGSASNTKKVR